MTDQAPIIRVRNVSKSFNGTRVLDAVSLDVAAGQITVVIGPSGCGKTVLLKHMIALIRPDRGEVFFHDDCISRMSERKLVAVRRRMGFLFQAGALFDSMTVGENVTFPMSEHAVGTPEERRDRCAEALSLVGLGGYEKRMPEELSGGQKKRVALARAVVLGPDVIFYDEPTTGLDPVRADLINELILKLRRALDTTAVVVTHDMASARKVADRVLMLHEGRFIADASPDRLDSLDNEIVQRFVEGRASREELASLEWTGAHRLGLTREDAE
jgi:phospholipid/cholesterol/gamma-HCH transport system ATP-binding protein